MHIQIAYTTTTKVVDVLPHTDIAYSQLPPFPENNEEKDEVASARLSSLLSDDDDKDWPFDKLPGFARVYGTAKGQISNPQRARRKEDQLRSMLRCILSLCSSTDKNQVDANEDSPFTIVDFGGGTGHLAIPLALLKPHFTIIVVDLHEKSVELLHSKIATATATTTSTCARDGPATTTTTRQQHNPPSNHDDERLRQCASIPNLYTFSGPLQSFERHFDVGVALHLCGEATDLALRKCGLVQARALVFAPCCVGKLNRNVKNPYIWQSTGSNLPTVNYPQSSLFGKYVTKEEDWNALARAADYGDAEQGRTARNAARRTAKALLETDRRLFLEEEFGYQTALARFEPWECTTKNDCILAWKPGIGISPVLMPDEECHMDVQKTMDYLLCQPTNVEGEESIRDSVDWTAAEEKQVRETLQNFLQESDEMTFAFPAGLPARRRKLVHYVAEKMSLVHWGEGKRCSEKRVIVQRRRQIPEATTDN